MLYNVVVPTKYGVMCVNRNDYCERFSGAGRALLETGEYRESEMGIFRNVLGFLPEAAVSYDIGANVGVHTLIMAQHPQVGRVYAFEPQRLVYQQLVANLALNSLVNVYAERMALGNDDGELAVPSLDPYRPAAFGSLELGRDQVEDIGQWPGPGGPSERVRLAKIDTLGLPDPDFLKVDVEGMEPEVVLGAKATILRARPIMFIDYLKNDSAELLAIVKGLKYDVYDYAPACNYLCIPAERMKIQGLPEL